MSGTQLLALAPLIAAAATAVLVLVLDMFGRRGLAVGLASVGLATASGLALWGHFGLPFAAVSKALLTGKGLTSVWAVIFALAALSVAGGARDLALRANGGGAAALIAMGALASAVLAGSLDLVMTLLALETVAVCAYGLVSASRTPAASEAAMKYLIQGAVASGLFVFGIAVAVGAVAGTSQLGVLGQAMSLEPLAATLAAVLLVCGFAFKLGAAPFHSWAPDAFETAPPSAGAFMAAAPKLGATTGLVLLSALVLESSTPGSIPTLSPRMMFGLLAALSIVVGNLAALKQTSYTRMLGYSGIAQIGYALVGLAIGAGVVAPVVLLVSFYGLAATAAFLAAAAVQARRSEWDGTISGMAGYAAEQPFVAIALTVTMLSLTGIPLTAGFIGKLLVFGPATVSGFKWLATLAIVGSVVSFGYYGSVMRTMFFDPAPEGEGDSSNDSTSDRPATVAIVVSALGLLVLGIVPFFVGLQPFLQFFAFAK